MAFLFWIFCANKFENHVGGSFPFGNASCYSRDLFPNANTGLDQLFSSWSSVFKLIICFCWSPVSVDHLFPNANTGVDQLVRLIICFCWSSLFKLTICLDIEHWFSNVNTVVDNFASDLKIMVDQCFKCHVLIHFNLLLIKTSVILPLYVMLLHWFKLASTAGTLYSSIDSSYMLLV